MNNQLTVIDNYSLYFRFIEQFLPDGFQNIDMADPLILKLEEMSEANAQFFSVFDLLQLKSIYTSKRSVDIIGVEPRDFNPSVFNKSLDPGDLIWFNMIREKLFNLGHQIFMDKCGTSLVSTNFRFINSKSELINTLFQCYLFYTEVPYKTVYVLQVLTDISWFRRATPGFHFYSGNDPYYFRFPDENLLMKGNVFSSK